MNTARAYGLLFVLFSILCVFTASPASAGQSPPDLYSRDDAILSTDLEKIEPSLLDMLTLSLGLINDT